MHVFGYLVSFKILYRLCVYCYISYSMRNFLIYLSAISDYIVQHTCFGMCLHFFNVLDIIGLYVGNRTTFFADEFEFLQKNHFLFQYSIQSIINNQSRIRKQISKNTFYELRGRNRISSAMLFNKELILHFCKQVLVPLQAM